jgi:transposase
MTVKTKKLKTVAINFKNHGLKNKEAADILDVSIRTVQRWRNDAEKTKVKVGRRKILPEWFIEEIENVIKKEPSTTLAQLSILAAEKGIVCSTSTMGRFMKFHNITHKKVSYTYHESNEQEVSQFKQEIGKSFQTEPTLAIDESSFRLNYAPRYGWAAKNSRAIGKRTGVRGVSYSLILCVGINVANPIVSYKLNKGSVKGPVFHDFLKDIDGEANCKLLLDNAAIHHASKSCEVVGKLPISKLAAEKNIDLVYLPKYSPQLNPTELCFGIIKRSIEKQRPSTYEQLEKAIEICLSRIKESIRKCFMKCLI